ncbi:hypothetical protein [Riemerella columbina]|uniref:hypothetical protein n=1 Tax=Riemerella columbina TaxID=103810 RepID=UPI00266F071F|nr:hypothetical protein [Riemerella columbina]WKS95554.1 hypothetical protein NYR17_02105 [Riemerella columbina]
MDELELLKKNWDNTSDFKTYTEQELFGMLKKKSISIAQWVLIIGILEISAWQILDLVLEHYTDLSTPDDMPWFITALDLFAVVMPIAFIILLLFFNFKIRSEENAKKLMQRILLTRKIVEWYIRIFLWQTAISFIIAYGYLGYNVLFDGTQSFWIKLLVFSALTLFTLALAGLFLYILRYLYQKLLYGKLLKQLKANYDELNHLEE